MTAKILLLATTTLLVGACDILGIGQVCTLEARPAIVVRVLDAATGEPPAADSGRIVVRDGAYADSAVLTPGSFEPEVRAALAYERRGTYTVEVDVAGYEHWTTEDVGVDETDDGCHVETEVITADLRGRDAQSSVRLPSVARSVARSERPARVRAGLHPDRRSARAHYAPRAG